MDPTLAAALGGLAGFVTCGFTVLAGRFSERRERQLAEPEPPPALPAGVADVLAVLRSSGIVLDSADAVVKNSPAAVSYGLVRRGELVHAELRQLARQVRRDGQIREVDLELPRGPMGRSSSHMRARVAPLGGQHILLLVEDMTQTRRVEEVRRDFVANVSHELKTPVGGLTLLAEAVQDAKDDPEAVDRFAERMQIEAQRLGQLVKEIVDLSRLQAADALHEPHLVDVAQAVTEAVDHTKVAADAHQIELVSACQPGLAVLGDHDLITTAVRNLIVNAINYSDPDTRVAVTSRRVGELVEITVTDQGQGIPEAEQRRIFERFYRVDAARSRATGGTGLGLAIVKHICANHGGDVTVWSEEGRGSTFTLRLPDASERAETEPVVPPDPHAPARVRGIPQSQQGREPTLHSTITQGDPKA
ncbi:MAG: ATP-binding protein [Micrococcales bacterium]|nr:ATP-binding protein [Micrococcales bacterium]